MINKLKLWWKALWLNQGKLELEAALIQANEFGCRESAEAAISICRGVWSKIGPWGYAESIAAVKFHMVVGTAIGDYQRSTVILLGVLSHAHKNGYAPVNLMSDTRSILASIFFKGLYSTWLQRPVDNYDKRMLLQVFPTIFRDLFDKEKESPTVDRVLLWISNN